MEELLKLHVKDPYMFEFTSRGCCTDSVINSYLNHSLGFTANTVYQTQLRCAVWLNDSAVCLNKGPELWSNYYIFTDSFIEISEIHVTEDIKVKFANESR